MAGIFISYRREDSSGWAGRLSALLKNRFGADQLFMDIDTIEAGVDFVEVIRTAVGSCEALLAVIGPTWTKVTEGTTGRRRLDNPEDFIRLEIGAALSRNIRVIPVLVGGAHMPDVADLPADLKPLARRNAHDLSDKRWDFDSEKLVAVLEKTLKRSASTNSKQAKSKPKVVFFSVLAAGGLFLLGSVLYPLLENFLRPPTALVTITTDPPGSLIELNGRIIGPSPVMKHNVAPGKIDARIQKENYSPQDTSFVLEANESHAIFIALRKFPDTNAVSKPKPNIDNGQQNNTVTSPQLPRASPHGKIALYIHESYLGRASATSRVQSEIRNMLSDSKYLLVDPSGVFDALSRSQLNAALRTGSFQTVSRALSKVADLVVVGSVSAEKLDNPYEGIYACEAVVDIRVIDARSGRTIKSISLDDEKEGGESYEAASRKLLRRLGMEIREDIILGIDEGLKSIATK